MSQSEALCRRLLDQAETPRDPQALQTRLGDLFVQRGGCVHRLRPDCSATRLRRWWSKATAPPLQTAASPRGKRTCDCPPGSKTCDHPKEYTSGTAQWCYHPHRGFVFGDESYTISAHVNGHDIPLMTIMGTGNESDVTLGPKALDELLKVIDEHDLPVNIDMFIGDGHHDALAFYRYCRVKGIRTVIPINGAASSDIDTTDTTKKNTKKNTNTTTPTHPHRDAYPDIVFDTDGTPLCPGGCRMRHEHYHKGKDAHFYTCPMKRRNGNGEWIFYATECPKHADCCPDKALGDSQYLKIEASPRYLPEIPRCSPCFTTLFKERTGVERSNAVEDHSRLDRCTRHAVYGLIRLTLVNVAKHARLRWLERRKIASARQILQEVIQRLKAEPIPTTPPQ